jgi:hypothetical protein
MTVAQLIGLLNQLPQDAPVSFNDEGGGTFHEDVDAAYYLPEFREYGIRARACVVLVVNPVE